MIYNLFFRGSVVFFFFGIRGIRVCVVFLVQWSIGGFRGQGILLFKFLCQLFFLVIVFIRDFCWVVLVFKVVIDGFFFRFSKLSSFCWMWNDFFLYRSRIIFFDYLKTSYKEFFCGSNERNSQGEMQEIMSLRQECVKLMFVYSKYDLIKIFQSSREGFYRESCQVSFDRFNFKKFTYNSFLVSFFTYENLKLCR